MIQEQLTQGQSWLYPSVEATAGTGAVPEHSALLWVSHSRTLFLGCPPAPSVQALSSLPFPFSLYFYRHSESVCPRDPPCAVQGKVQPIMLSWVWSLWCSCDHTCPCLLHCWGSFLPCSSWMCPISVFITGTAPIITRCKCLRGTLILILPAAL